jgi:hypothetical protein
MPEEGLLQDVGAFRRGQHFDPGPRPALLHHRRNQHDVEGACGAEGVGRGRHILGAHIVHVAGEEDHGFACCCGRIHVGDDNPQHVAGTTPGHPASPAYATARHP